MIQEAIFKAIKVSSQTVTRGHNYWLSVDLCISVPHIQDKNCAKQKGKTVLGISMGQSLAFVVSDLLCHVLAVWS